MVIGGLTGGGAIDRTVGWLRGLGAGQGSWCVSLQGVLKSVGVL